MAGLKALFNLNNIRQSLNESVSKIEDKTLEALAYEGEEFVDKARLIDTYKDRTANLRASIGYIIVRDGKTVKENFEGEDKGVSKAKEVANEVALKYPKGFVLIGVAGMNYAAAVESKGYDVITGSAPGDDQIKNLLSAITV